MDDIINGYSKLSIYFDSEDSSVVCLNINGEEIWLNKEEKNKVIEALNKIN